ncbi:MAG: hypothetical protein AAFW68_11250 [Pseudomonadota bacterium]
MTAAALTASSAFEDTPAIASPRFAAPPMMAAPLGFMKNTTQGACAGLLTLAGATQLSAANIGGLRLSDWSLETIGAQLVMGNFTGLLQIIAAAALFITAGRGLARVFGMLLFVAAAVAYFNGVDVQQIVEQSQTIYQALGPAYETFQTALMEM